MLFSSNDLHSCHVLEVFSKEELSSVQDHPLIQCLNDAYVIATNENQPRQGWGQSCKVYSIALVSCMVSDSLT